MSKIVQLTVLKEGVEDRVASRIQLFNVSKLSGLEQKTLSVKGVSNAGTRFLYDENISRLAKRKDLLSYFVDENKSVIKTAIETAGAADIKVFDVTVVPETGANYTKSIRVDQFLYAYDHPTAAGDSRLVILSDDGTSKEVYRVDQTQAALLALANA